MNTDEKVLFIIIFLIGVVLGYAWAWNRLID